MFGLQVSFDIRHSTFGIQLLIQIWFMVPIYGIKSVEAFHDCFAASRSRSFSTL